MRSIDELKDEYLFWTEKIMALDDSLYHGDELKRMIARHGQKRGTELFKSWAGSNALDVIKFKERRAEIAWEIFDRTGKGFAAGYTAVNPPDGCFWRRVS